MQLVETSPSMSKEAPTYEKPLQTTNQVKANLINANMIKGDMILTKPGQGRNNPKITVVQKQVLMKSNELKNIGLKKAVLVSKGKVINPVGAKVFATKDGKLIQLPVTSKTVSPNIQVTQAKTVLTQAVSQQSVQLANPGSSVQQQPKTIVSIGTPLKIKANEVKREKRKSDAGIESPSKEVDSVKSIENKMTGS